MQGARKQAKHKTLLEKELFYIITTLFSTFNSITAALYFNLLTGVYFISIQPHVRGRFYLYVFAAYQSKQHI